MNNGTAFGNCTLCVMRVIVGGVVKPAEIYNCIFSTVGVSVTAHKCLFYAAFTWLRIKSVRTTPIHSESFACRVQTPPHLSGNPREISVILQLRTIRNALIDNYLAHWVNLFHRSCISTSH